MWRGSERNETSLNCYILHNINKWFTAVIWCLVECENVWYICMHVCVLSHVRLFVTSWTVIHQAPLSMEFSRQEYWSGLSLPTSRDLPNPGTEPASPALAGEFYSTVHLGGSYFYLHIFMLKKKAKIASNLTQWHQKVVNISLFVG